MREYVVQSLEIEVHSCFLNELRTCKQTAYHHKELQFKRFLRAAAPGGSAPATEAPGHHANSLLQITQYSE